MSDVRNTDPENPNSPNERVPPRNGLQFFLDHYWKLFAIVVLSATLYFGNQVLSNWYVFRAMSMTVTSEASRPGSYELQNLVSNQSGPATVVFKTESPVAVGYLAQSDDDFVTLNTVYKAESRAELILIPWDNILYVKMNLKEADPKK